MMSNGVYMDKPHINRSASECKEDESRDRRFKLLVSAPLRLSWVMSRVQGRQSEGDVLVGVFR